MKALVLGDTHIPNRASGIPPKLLKIMTSHRFDVALFTGDLEGKSVMNLLSPVKTYAVGGNMDHLPLPRVLKLRLAGISIGLIHGNGVHPRGNEGELAAVAKRMDVKVLISGHTHRLSVRSIEAEGANLILLDPGSATGCWGGGPASRIPSLVTLEMEGNFLLVRTYELINDELVDRQYTFRVDS